MINLQNKSWPTMPLESWRGTSLLLTTDEEIFLIKRSMNMPTHPGEMAFFGGNKKIDETDPVQTIKREFEEETGLSSDVLDIYGTLPMVLTSQGQGIVTVVAKLKMTREDFFREAVSNGEWIDLIALPITTALDINNWCYGERVTLTTRQKILLFPIAPNQYSHFQNKTSQIFTLWGATAKMVWQFLEILD